MLPVECSFRDISRFEFPNKDKEFIKSRLKDFVFTSFQSYNYDSKNNLKWAIGFEQSQEIKELCC